MDVSFCEVLTSFVSHKINISTHIFNFKASPRKLQKLFNIYVASHVTIKPPSNLIKMGLETIVLFLTVWLAKPPKRYVGDELLFDVFRHRFRHRRLDKSGSYEVHPDAEFPELLGRRLR